jgi:Bacterial Ig-like domain
VGTAFVRARCQRPPRPLQEERIASAAIKVTLDMVAPEAPVIAHSAINGHTVTLIGTAEANGTVKIYDEGGLLGSTTANDDGGWSCVTDNLANGKHVFTATDTDVAGNTSIESDALSTIINHRPPLPAGLYSIPSNEVALDDLHRIELGQILHVEGASDAQGMVRPRFRRSASQMHSGLRTRCAR